MITRLPLPASRSSARLTSGTLHVYNTRLAARSHEPCVRRAINLPPCQNFSGSARQAADRSLYDVLGVSANISKSDLKKRFYTLSRETHPDVNPDKKEASERFAEVSEAYSVLGNEEKRKKYDRDVMPRFAPKSSRGSTGGRSGTYAGSRPATGLSTRRGTFRGPPPSFYQNAARSDAEEAQREYESYSAGAQAGQFDPSQYAAAGTWDPTFNAAPVYKTQSAEDIRRQSRKQAEMAAAQQYAEEQSNFWARFIIVSGVVGFGVGVGTIINQMSNAPRGGLLKSDGSKRRIEKQLTGSK